MSEFNAESFKELEPYRQQELLSYISNNFKPIKSFNRKHTAYGLKQRFTRLHVNPKHHVTTQCFMEAMLEAGYTARKIKNISETDWYFNVSVPRF